METTAEMSTAALSSYLADHLAGSAAGVEMAERLAEHHPGDDFFTGLVHDIKSDQETLERLMKNVGAAQSDFKKSGAVMAEKLGAGISGIGASATEHLGTLRVAELLAMGILGKMCLWESIGEVADADDRLSGFNYDELAKRARRQIKDLGVARLKMARKAFLH